MSHQCPSTCPTACSPSHVPRCMLKPLPALLNTRPCQATSVQETDAAVAPRLHSQPQEYESQRPRAELCIASTSCCYFVYQSHCIASTILHRLLGLLHTTLFAEAHPPIHPPFPFPFPFSFPAFTVPNPCALISHMAPCHWTVLLPSSLCTHASCNILSKSAGLRSEKLSPLSFLSFTHATAATRSREC